MNASACLSVAEWLQGANYCKTVGAGTVDVIPVLQNTCSSAIRCKVCGDFNSAAGECEVGELAAGQRQGGWATQWVWCDAKGIMRYCSLATDDVVRRERDVVARRARLPRSNHGL